MQIPDKVELAGMTITTVFVTDKPTNNIVGEANFRRNQIILHTLDVAQQHLEQAYLHELTHWILFIMNEQKLRHNERFVDLFSHFFYQFVESKNV